jgi:hypothetical protein
MEVKISSNCTKGSFEPEVELKSLINVRSDIVKFAHTNVLFAAETKKK